MLNLSPILATYILTITLLLGLSLGSFSNCLAWRIAHGESIVHGRSHCAVCNHPLSALELIPLFSWLFQKGRCRHCGEMISVRYPLTELVCGLCFVGLVLRYDVSVVTLEYMVLTVILLTIALVDLETGLIPDRLLAAGIVNFVLFCVFDSRGFLPALGIGFLRGLVVSLPLLLLVLAADKVLGRESMGGGDLKFFYVLGLYFNWKCSLFLLLLSCILGIAFFAIFQKVRISGDEKAIPFGPAIAAAAYVSLLAAEPVVHWYMGLFSL